MQDDPHYTLFAQNFGKGIGHPLRFTILSLLAKRDMTVSELIEHTGARQSAVSQHLLVLKNGQLILSQKRGQYVFYSLNHQYLLTGLKGITQFLETKTTKEGAV